MSRRSKNRGVGEAAGESLEEQLAKFKAPDQDIPTASIDESDHTFMTRLGLSPDDAAINELKSSINKVGLINAITLRKRQDGKHQVVTGFRRLLATKQLGKTKIKAKVISVSDEDGLRMAVNENRARMDLNTLEWAMLCDRLTREQRKTYDEVREILGFGPKQIERLKKMLHNLIDQVKDALRKGQISQTVALSITKVDPSKQESLLRKVIQEKWTVKQVDEYIKNATPPDQRRDAQVSLGLPNRIELGRKRLLVRLATREQLKQDLQILLSLLDSGKLDSFIPEAPGIQPPAA